MKFFCCLKDFLPSTIPRSSLGMNQNKTQHLIEIEHQSDNSALSHIIEEKNMDGKTEIEDYILEYV